MPVLPEGEAAPADGILPPSAAQGAGQRSWSIYIHVPFCLTRCGYCDFNTYTAAELGPGVNRGSFADAVLAELVFASTVLANSGVPERRVHSIFFGGGTPTLLPPSDLARILEHIGELWGLEPEAEVSTEANPDTLTPTVLEQLARAGFTRVSLGMQSAVPHVLASLGRTHTPERVQRAVDRAREAGLSTSLDLIYGTPGESLSDWRFSLDEVMRMEPDHISAYALTVEPGTALAAAVARGRVAPVSADDQAEKYELADECLVQAGYQWYEISNWAQGSEMRCRHNVAYWRNQDWWGAGPGAHSHVGGVRWWNVKHPRPYSQRVHSGLSPAAGREVLAERARKFEALMLGLRLVEGLALEACSVAQERVVAALKAEGLVESWPPGVPGSTCFRLTRRGRLLADHVLGRLAEALV